MRIGSSLVRALEGNGYEASWEQTGRGGLDAVAAGRPDLVLLDLGLPDIDGLEVCGRIHEVDPSIAVVMLTAREDELDVVVGLDAGAVDYVAKPFGLAELLARVRAHLRRATPPHPERLVAGDVEVDIAARRVWLAGNELDLRAKEFDLLARLAREAGAVVTRETLMSDVWDEHWFGSTKTLDFHIAALRRKLDAPDAPSHISTLRGVGYRLEVP